MLAGAFGIVFSIFTVGLAVASVWFVAGAVRTLGRQWTYAARLIEGHKLVTEGPYSVVRNPIYTGMFGMLIATGLAMEHWIALLIAIPLFIAGLVIRVRTEEKLLRSAFGGEFEEYAKRVPAVIPGIY
jgi:protein-S-isoprenylcysteine O-methyltransferase Ste14